MKTKTQIDDGLMGNIVTCGVTHSPHKRPQTSTHPLAGDISELWSKIQELEERIEILEAK